MARTVEQIYDSMVAQMNAETELAGLAPQADDAQTLLADVESPSIVADHRLWMWAMAFFTWLLELLFDDAKLDIRSREGKGWGHLRWWQQRLLAFQYGYELDFDDETIIYADTESPAAIASRIIKYAAAIQAQDSTGPKVLLKAAKDLAGEPDPLSGAEMTSLAEYCEQIQAAGVRIELLSQSADLLKLVAEVRFNPLVLTNTGELIGSPGTFPVKDAIEVYLKAIKFNGQLSLTALKDAVQLVDGVNDFIIISAERKVGVNPWTQIQRLYNTFAGFIRMSTVTGETLDDTLTYVPGA